MRVIKRYLSAEITTSTLLVFAALLMLFSFLDLIHELGDLGRGGYRLPHIFAFVLLSVPGHVYELFPIAALIEKSRLAGTSIADIEAVSPFAASCVSSLIHSLRSIFV